MDRAQYINNLRSRGLDVHLSYLYSFGGNLPFRTLEIKLRPFSHTQLTVAHKHVWRKLQYIVRRRMANIPVDSAQQFPYAFRLGNRRAMFDVFGVSARLRSPAELCMARPVATPRFVRGRNKGKTRDAIYHAQQRGDSIVVHQRVADVAKSLARTSSYSDSMHNKLAETRKAVVAGWLGIADNLTQQDETALANEVRHFARHLPRVLTDRERLAVQFTLYLQTKDREMSLRPDPVRERTH